MKLREQLELEVWIAERNLYQIKAQVLSRQALILELEAALSRARSAASLDREERES